MKNQYHKDLKEMMDKFVNKTYDVTQNFPKEEVYGVTSQLRRSSLSVVLNYIEGFARQGNKQYKHFLQISYGSLKESLYLIEFSYKREYLAKKDYKDLAELGDKIGAMLWGVISKLGNKQEL